MAAVRDYFTQRVAVARWRLYLMNIVLWISFSVASGSWEYARRLGAKTGEMVLFGLAMGAFMLFVMHRDQDRFPSVGPTRHRDDTRLTTND
jgi:hypothetical protein